MATPISLEQSTAYKFMLEFAALKKSNNLTGGGVGLFDRWVVWMEGNQENDPNGYDASTTTIFSLIIELSEHGVIGNDVKGDMRDRALSVIKNPNKDSDLTDFLQKMKKL